MSENMRADDLTFNTDGKLLFHGIYTGLTRENLEDIRFYGIEPTDETKQMDRHRERFTHRVLSEIRPSEMLRKDWQIEQGMSRDGKEIKIKENTNL